MIIRYCQPMLSRPCRYCLSLQDGSVFLDLDVDQNDCLYLVRISFDGYGCCKPAPNAAVSRIDKAKSAYLIRCIENKALTDPDVAKIVSHYLRENADLLWMDALTQHQLI